MICVEIRNSVSMTLLLGFMVNRIVLKYVRCNRVEYNRFMSNSVVLKFKGCFTAFRLCRLGITELC